MSFCDEIDETSDAINLHLTPYFCIAVNAISNSDLSFMIEYISSFVLYWCLYGDQLISDEFLPRFSLRKFFIIMHMTCQRKMVFSRSLTQQTTVSNPGLSCQRLSQKNKVQYMDTVSFQ